MPRWSPDGRTIAFIGGLMSDEGVTGGDIYLVSGDRRRRRETSPPDLEGVSQLARLAPVLGVDPLRRAPRRRQRPRPGGPGRRRDPTLGGAERITAAGPGLALGVSASRDQATLALIRQILPRAAGDLGRCDRADGGRHARATGRSRPEWGEAESLHWKSDDSRSRAGSSTPATLDPGRALSAGRPGPRRAVRRRSRPAGWARIRCRRRCRAGATSS